MTFKQRFIKWCEARCDRPADKYILQADGSLYMRRWHVIPRNRFFNIYFHDFLRSDEDRALHDHPWLFNASIIVRGMYKEVTPQGIKFRFEGDVKFRWGKAIHRVELFAGPRPCRTIFITGPVVREWGFYCPRRWVPWREFTHLENGVSQVTKGCAE